MYDKDNLNRKEDSQMTVLLGVKLKLYPNKKQKQTIEQTFGNKRTN